MKTIIETNVGTTRTENQDRATNFIKGDIQFSILCDGMGGYAGGSEAAEIAIHTFKESFNTRFPSNVTRYDAWFNTTTREVITKIQQFSQKDPKLSSMGTTISAVIITPSKLYVYNIGDSRVYLINQTLNQITKDQSIGTHLEDYFGMSEEETRGVTHNRSLTSAASTAGVSNIDKYVIKRDENIEYIILTSDGIHDYVTDEAFYEIMMGSNLSLSDKALELIRVAMIGESSDNLTTIVCQL